MFGYIKCFTFVCIRKGVEIHSYYKRWIFNKCYNDPFMQVKNVKALVLIYIEVQFQKFFIL